MSHALRCNLKRLLPALLIGLNLLANAYAAEGEITLGFAGDLMLADTPGRVVQRGEDPFRYIAQTLKTVDVRIGNLECVVGTGGKAIEGKPYAFEAHPRVLPVLKKHFDYVALANNHSGDFGRAVFAQMLGRLKQANISYVGGGKDLAEAHAPAIIERNGLRIALLSYNEFKPRQFEADADRPGVAWSEDEQVVRDIQLARQRWNADLVIPFMHWGWENETAANERQRTLARLMIDAGADAIIGGHPHVIQNIEIYKDKPIVYSLGDFLFDGFTDEANNTGWFLKLKLDRQGAASFRTLTARMDKEGLPHPKRNAIEQCWSRGESTSHVCPPP